MCSPKTMLKIGVGIAIPLAIGYIAFPQFRPAIAGLAPFALFALCPLAMMFGMKGMMGKSTNGGPQGRSSCDHDQPPQLPPSSDRASNQPKP